MLIFLDLFASDLAMRVKLRMLVQVYDNKVVLYIDYAPFTWDNVVRQNYVFKMLKFVNLLVNC